MADEFKINNFDLLRILAATQVVLVHSIAHLGLGRPLGLPLVEAFPGVPIFFAISGFLISASFERARDVRSYARNRVLRIYPGLWCVVLVTVPVAALFGFDFLHLRALLWLACQLVGLIFTPGFLKSFGFGSYNGALWTIPIELQFYVLLPFFYLGVRTEKSRTAVFGAAWLAFVIVAFLYALRAQPLAENAIETLPHKLFRYSFIPHIYMFLTGVLLQRLHAQRSRWIVGKGLAWMAAYLVVHFTVPWGAVGYVAGSLMMAVATISLAYTAPGLSQRLLRGNDLSYGVYIYHGLILNILIELGYVGRISYVPLVIALAFVAGWLSWRFVERPFLRRKRGALHAVPGGAG
jgi:peptidoglycan/LPS O-acetylase OafA/YrhL